MFSVCRRGNASLIRAVNTATRTTITSSRPSTLKLSKKVQVEASMQIRSFHVPSQLRFQASEASTQQSDDLDTTKSARPQQFTKFQELLEYGAVHKNVISEVTGRMKLETMTDVQTATINQALQGTDIAAQARTGTGKTLGFLIPTVENILRKNPELAVRKRYSRARASDIRAIIISPTRELAEQIAVEANKICDNTDLRVQVAVGGTAKRAMLRKTQMDGCHLLVATPGRLNDLLTDEFSGIKADKLTTLVLDEADRLLDQGFATDIANIISLLPDRRAVDRQTLLFSATIPKEVMHLVREHLKPDFHFVQTVKEGDVQTHEKVPQKIVVTPGHENWMPTLLELAKREIEKAGEAALAGTQNTPFKAIVYFQSTNNVELSFQIFDCLQSNNKDKDFSRRHPLHPAEISHIHGKLTQQERTSVADRFRRAKSAILFSTDVTARGMDFPNVSHVVQIGLPSNREQYVHRIGRTGRADKGGEGWIIIDDTELTEARKMLRGFPINPDQTLEVPKVDMTKDAQLPVGVAQTLTQIGEATRLVSSRTKSGAYLAQLGQLGTRNKDVVLEKLNRWTKFGWGWPDPPPVSSTLASRLRLPTDLINLQSSAREPREERSFGGFGGSDNVSFSGRRQSGGYGDSQRGRGRGRQDGFGDSQGGRGRGRQDGFGDFGGDNRRGGHGGGYGGGGRQRIQSSF